MRKISCPCQEVRPARSSIATPTTLHSLPGLLTAESDSIFRAQKRSLRSPPSAALDTSEVQSAPGNFLSVRGPIRLQMYTDVSHDTDRKWRTTLMSRVGQQTTADYAAQVMVKEFFFLLALMCWAQMGTHKFWNTWVFNTTVRNIFHTHITKYASLSVYRQDRNIVTVRRVIRSLYQTT